MKIKIKDMFSLVLIYEIADYPSHKFVLKKQIMDFLSTPEFFELYELRDKIREIANSIRQSYSQELNSYSQKLQSYHNTLLKDLPEDVREEAKKFNELKMKVENEINLSTSEMSKKFDEVFLKEDEYEIPVLSDKVVSCIKKIVLHEDLRIEDLENKGLPRQFIDAAIELVLKLEK